MPLLLMAVVMWEYDKQPVCGWDAQLTCRPMSIWFLKAVWTQITW